MNKFDKVSFEQYWEDTKDTFGDLPDLSYENVMAEYEDLQLPKRATKHSAGYDFYMPFSLKLKANTEVKIPTGIKCSIDEDKFLAIMPRSSLGFKNEMRLANTLGIIDCDFFNNVKNEGHIFIKFKVSKDLILKKGEAFAQGIFLPYYTTVDDNVTQERVGGIGSTNTNL